MFLMEELASFGYGSKEVKQKVNAVRCLYMSMMKMAGMKSVSY